MPLQVVTSVLAFYTRGKPPLTFSCPGKTPADYWGKSSGETELLFHQGELLHGCMDKAQYGKFGLVHAVQVQSSCHLHIIYTRMDTPQGCMLWVLLMAQFL